MLLYSSILLVLAFGYVHGKYNCTYLDPFGKAKQLYCDTGCCGNLHLAYCCNRYQDAIIICSTIIAVFLVVAIIVVTIHCRYRRRGRTNLSYISETRNYGTINGTSEHKESTKNTKEQPVQDITAAAKEDIEASYENSTFTNRPVT